jgi:D-aminopeptidase
MRIEFKSTEMADRTQIIPAVERLSGKVVQFVEKDMPSAYRMFMAVAGIAG